MSLKKKSNPDFTTYPFITYLERYIHDYYKYWFDIASKNCNAKFNDIVKTTTGGDYDDNDARIRVKVVPRVVIEVE